ncbi:hypothetical protein H1D31_02545 [Alishewanella sp. BS5-314]|uniref:ORC-CDC6 family AAA ATPase n=1 Tax=Alishewanella sp. BS5-314 TaxID=2755587 RepID=UPI0021BA8433|nr:hypothetical protein [Alishewanella sp. BS5-314]MCT8124917.1 hypothetical protein [Alishewanella sp. BS5-314]
MKIFFDSLNAKHLKSSEIAETFVVSSHFEETAKHGHTILIGPRGSGKTTILRMLSNDVLPKWEKINKKNRYVDYQGVYVPGDIVWGEMIRTLNNAGVNRDAADEFAYIAFCTHVYLATVEAIEYYIKSVQNEAGNEFIQSRYERIYDAFNAICSTLKISLDRVSISRIRIALNQRLADLGAFCRQKCDDGNLTLSILRQELPFSTIELKQSLESIFSAIDFALDRNDQRWAVLLDEFEIAPKYLLDSVLANMRSSAKKIMFKVALVPCGVHQDIKYNTSSVHDYSVVELWFNKFSDISSFCGNIVKNRFEIEEPEQIFGITKFISNKPGGASDWSKQFSELEEKDVTFKSFLLDKKIEYKTEFANNASPSSNIRKISLLVAFRNAFLNSNGKRKGRKKLTEFYSGWEAITRISEGNPRWLIATIRSLITDEKIVSRIDESKQMDSIYRVTNSYCAMLKTTALNDNMGISCNYPPFDLLEKISKYFNSKIIDFDFKSSVVGSFTIDNKISQDVKNSLMIAWNHGAIVLIDNDKTFGTYKDIDGMRFRISYLLAPKFELPLRTEKGINLSTILTHSSSTPSIKEEPCEPQQRNLFDD